MGGQLGVKPQVGVRTSELNRLPRELVFRALAGEHRAELGGDGLKDTCPALVLGPAMVGEESEHCDDLALGEHGHTHSGRETDRRAVSILGPSRRVNATSIQTGRLSSQTVPGSPSPGPIVCGALASTKNASISGDAAHHPGASSRRDPVSFGIHISPATQPDSTQTSRITRATALSKSSAELITIVAVCSSRSSSCVLRSSVMSRMATTAPVPDSMGNGAEE